MTPGEFVHGAFSPGGFRVFGFPRRAATRAAPTIGQIVGAIKSISANRCREAGLSGKLWQRGYYEHVIRNEKDYLEICAYIENNPARWAVDRYYQA